MKHPLCRILPAALAAALLLAGCGRTAAGTGDPGGSASPSLSAAQGEEGSQSSVGTPPEQPEQPEERTEAEPQAAASELVEDNRTDEDGSLLLTYRHNTVTVSIPGNEEAAAVIQADLDSQSAALALRADELELSRREAPFSGGEYYLEGRYTVTRADSGVISLLYCETSYAGGVHGSTVFWGYTYDTATGQRLTLSALGEDLKKTADGLCQALAQQVEAYQPGFFFEGYLEGVSSSVVTDDTFWMTDTGLQFVDNEYVLQSYAGGTLQFFLPYGALQGALEERYFLAVEEEEPASVSMSDGKTYTQEEAPE